MHGTSPNTAPSTLGTYEILRHVADGGMAEIYLARTKGVEGFEKVVIVKRILPKLARDDGYIRLFIDEAKLGALLVHPNIAGVYDIGVTGGEYFFAMEFVHGQDLRAVLRRCYDTNALMPIAHAVHIARSVAAALHYAHERRGSGGVGLGIVHRDISPANVMVSYDGSVKLLDFGVARSATRSMKTRTGTLKGKVSYMSPEQARGTTLDRRSDVYSLGIVLWEMIATKRLHKAGNDLATIQKIVLEDAPSVALLRPDCPPALAEIVARALDRDLKRRYQTAQELELALEELAVELRLKQSPVALASLMSSLFMPELDAWRIAEETGKPLSTHIAGSQPALPAQPAASAAPDAEFVAEPEEVDELPEDSDDFDDKVPAPIVPAPPVVLPRPKSPTAPVAVAPVAVAPVAVAVEEAQPLPQPVETFDDLDDPPRARHRPTQRSESIAAEIYFLDKSRRRMRWLVGLSFAAVVLATVLIAMRCRSETKSEPAPSAPSSQTTPPAPEPSPPSSEPAAAPAAAIAPVFAPAAATAPVVAPPADAAAPVSTEAVAPPTKPKPTRPRSAAPKPKPKPKWYE